MKNLIFTLILLYTTFTYSQVFVNISTDPKVLTIGTDNKYTEHSARFNYEVAIEYIFDEDSYISLGHKYVDLNQSFNNYHFKIGQLVLTKIDRLILNPNLELGFIKRELIRVNDKDFRHNPGYLYVQGNLQVRYNLNEVFFLTTQGYLALATDLPEKTFRYGGTIGVSMSIFTPKNGF